MRRPVRVAVALGVMTAATALGAVPTATRAPEPTPPAADLVEDLRAGASGPVQVRPGPTPGAVGFVGTEPGRPLRPGGGDPTEAAVAFADRYAPALGAAGTDLVAAGTTPRLDGGVAVRFQQEVDGTPVFGAQASVQVNGDGAVLSSLADLSTRAGEAPTGAPVDATEARAAALAAVAKSTNVDAAALAADEGETWVYDPTVVGPPSPFGVRLTWRFEVTSADPPVRQVVLIDAATGTVALSFSRLDQARDRRVCDFAGRPTAEDPTCTAPYDRTESQGPTGVADVDAAHDHSGRTYDFFQSRFGRDSLDGEGVPIVSAVGFCEGSCPYANAYWNGEQATYGPGFATDDVVAHELTHAVTEFSAGLFYWYQSGAINESISDVFGELVDLAHGADDTPANRWLIGEDLPNGALRDMASPPAFGDPDAMTSASFVGGNGDSGGVHSNSGVNNKAASLMTDGGTFGGHEVTGLGPEKVAAVYYETLTTMLTSASDYQDLHAALPQACLNLVGVGGLGLTIGDCQEVQDAVDAVAMDVVPAGQPTDAPVCAAGVEPLPLFRDDLEDPGSGNWVVDTEAGWGWYHPQNPNPYAPAFDATYATSGTTNFFGLDSGDPGRNGAGVVAPGEHGDGRIAMTADVDLPEGTTPYLRFRHAFGFEAGGGVNWDGGVVEYSTDDGASWQDVGNRFTHNGYNGVLNEPETGPNPLQGRAAFVGLSKGYQSSRVDLSTMAGGDIRFRFRIGEDALAGGYGWFVDDIEIYLCPEPALSFSQSADQSAVTVGETVDLHLTVANTGNVALTGVTIADEAAPDCEGPVPDVAVGASRTVDCSYTTVAPTDVGTWSNTATVAVDQFPGATASNPVAVDVLEPGTPALTFTQTVDEPTVALGGEVSLHLTVRNTGNVELTGATILAPEAPACEVEAFLDPLPAGGHDTVDCTHTPTSVGTWTSTAAVTTNELTEPTAAPPVQVEVLDVLAPSVVLTAPADGALVNQGQVVAADFSCADDQPGEVDCVGRGDGRPVADGQPVDTTTPGDHTFSVTATDAADNVEVLEHTYTVAARRPDGRIRQGATGATVGDDRVNPSGMGQSLTARVARGGRATFFVTTENDGTHPEAFTVRGQPSASGYTVAYTAGGRNVGPAIRAGTYLTPVLAPGAVHTVKVVVTVGSRAAPGSQVDRMVTVTSTSDPQRSDVVRFIVRRR